MAYTTFDNSSWEIQKSSHDPEVDHVFCEFPTHGKILYSFFVPNLTPTDHPFLHLYFPEETLSLKPIEARHIQRVLEGYHGNPSEKLKILGIDRSTLLARLKKISPSS